MLNYIWLGLILAAAIVGGLTGHLPEVTTGAFNTAKSAVMEIALPLAGIMAIWLGMMRLAEQSGFVQVLARVLKPLMCRLFPDVPADHPAMGSMVMNMAANMLGLGNAATPLGLRAMSDLEKLNPRPGVATNAMCTFLAINTSSIQLIPTTVIGILAVSGSLNPTAIVSTSFLATLCAATAAIIAVKFLEKLPAFRLDPLTAPLAEKAAVESESRPVLEVEKVSVPELSFGKKCFLFLYLALFAIIFGMLVAPDAANHLLGYVGNFTVAPLSPEMMGKGLVIRALSALSTVAIPLMLSFFPLYAAMRGVKVYEQFVEGAKEAIPTVLRIIPFLVAMLVAVGMFRTSGCMDILAKLLSPALKIIHLPVDVLPIVLMRPLSGGATLGLFTDLVKRFGPDHFNSLLGATIFGSTETTFYVLTVYFGSVAVRKTRHAVLAGLIADAVGVIASIIICTLRFG
ncbi:MAG: nucleoside recognition domain-containing protein [Chthoniobacteraceae bacterium]